MKAGTGLVLVAVLAACGSETGSGASPSGGASLSRARGEIGAHAQVRSDSESLVASKALKAPAVVPSAQSSEIADGSISGDLLATLLVQNTDVKAGQAGNIEYYNFLAPEHPALPLSGPLPGRGREWVAPRVPRAMGSQRFLNGPFEMESLAMPVKAIRPDPLPDDFTRPDVSRRHYEGGEPLYTLFRGGMARLNVGLRYSVPPDDLQRGADLSTNFKTGANQPAGKVLAEPGDVAAVRIWLPDSLAVSNYENASQAYGLLPTGTSVPIRAGERIALGTVLQRWQDKEGNRVDFSVRRGEVSNEARLCTDVDTKEVRRLTCTIWRVGANWRFGSDEGLEYRGVYLADDRSRHAGGRGTLYWQTLKAEQRRKPPVPRMGQRATAAVSDEGVSADVVATMLTQQNYPWDPETRNSGNYLRARRTDGPFPDGKLIDPPAPPVVIARHDVRDAPDHKVTDGPPPDTVPFHLLLETFSGFGEDSGNVPYHGVSIGFPISSVGGVRAREEGGHLKPKPGVLLNSGVELLNLGYNAIRNPQSSVDKVALHPVKAAALRKDALIAWGHVVQRWRANAGHGVDIRILRGSAPDEARACFDYRFDKVRGQLCSRWQVPAGWQFGQALVPLNTSVVDDRSMVEGESGMMYWETFPK
ncbi:MAG: hypothetical protein Q4D91_10890 [Lautropia sp.]|nr:hypothetical protein [Lautropia sp.]